MVDLGGLVTGLISFGVFAGIIYILYRGFKLTNKDKNSSGGSSNNSGGGSAE